LLDVAQGRHFEALSHERVTDFLNSVSDHGAILVNNHVDSLFNVTLIKVVKVGEGFASGRSKKKACHPFFFVVLYSASDKADAYSTLNVLTVTGNQKVSVDIIWID